MDREDKPSEFDRLDDDLNPARGIIFGVLLGVGLMVAAWFGGLWRLFS